MIKISPIARERIIAGDFPVTHLSISSARSYNANARDFLIKYILWQFDDSTGYAFLVGQAVHKALEVWYDRSIIVGAGEDRLDFCIRKAKELIDNTVARKRVQALGKDRDFDVWIASFIEKNPSKESDMQIVRSILTRSSEFIKNEEFDESLVNFEFIKDTGVLDGWTGDMDTLIKWSRGSHEDALALVDETVRRYVAYVGEGFVWGTPSYFEAKGLGFIMDPLFSKEENDRAYQSEDQEGYDPLEGRIPVQMKGVIDRIDVEYGENGEAKACTVVDYKTVDTFSDETKIKGSYELAAGMYYFICLLITGIAPRAMKYIEIAKGDPKPVLVADPSRKMLQADLKEEATKAGLTFEKFVKNAELEDMLVRAGIMAKPDPVKVITFDFEEDPLPIILFSEYMKGTINSIAIDEDFRPNPDSFISGDDSYRDWREEQSLLLEGMLDPVRHRIAEAKKRREEGVNTDALDELW